MKKLSIYTLSKCVYGLNEKNGTNRSNRSTDHRAKQREEFSDTIPFIKRRAR